MQTGTGNSTITTGAGDSTVTTNTGNNTITTGAGTSHIKTGAGLGNDTITTGAGDAVVDSGIGNDTVTTGAGDDTVTYHYTGNVGTHSVFNGGAGMDTLKLVMTSAEYENAELQNDLTNYKEFLEHGMGANGEDAYTFTTFGLTASMFEHLLVKVGDIYVIGIDPDAV